MGTYTRRVRDSSIDFLTHSMGDMALVSRCICLWASAHMSSSCQINIEFVTHEMWDMTELRRYTCLLYSTQVEFVTPLCCVRESLNV